MHRIATFLLVATAALLVAPAYAQQFDPLANPSGIGGGLIDQFDPVGAAAAEPAKISTEIVPATVEYPAVLLVTAQIADRYHTYSLTQPAGGPQPTRIELAPSSDYRLLDTFRASPAPTIHIQTGPVWTGQKMEEHTGTVTWFAPIEITAGVDASKLAIAGSINMQVCEATCIPVQKEFTARVTKQADLPPAIAEALQKAFAQSAIRNPQSAIGAFQVSDSSVKLSGRLVPSVVRPGDTARIEITAALGDTGRVYAHTDRDNRKGTKPVLIVINTASGLLPQRATTDAPIKTDSSIAEFGEMRYHQGQVTWTLPVQVPANVMPGEFPIQGYFGYQACEYGADGKNVCEMPQAVEFTAKLTVGDQANTVPSPLTFSTGPQYSRVAAAANVFADHLDRQAGGKPTGPVQPEPPAVARSEPPTLSAGDPYRLDLIEVAKPQGSLWYYIALAFVGGIILNLMPCVLPVIGLKVMSFVEQAGKSRSHALVLNLWFAVGIIAVFLVLALLASLPKLGLGSDGLVWGGQNGSTVFNVTIAAVVFAMALSLLGVWEVPIPGFFGSSSVHKAATQEGPLGAVLKGVVTTVLATPCTAPFMATAVAWAVSQPLATTLAVFASLGLGMASPYVLIGVFPELLRFLPKPGPWMETFKQIAGFVLLATVVFILSYVEAKAVVPTILLLLGIAFACWLVGRTPLTAESRERLLAWGYAGGTVLIFVAVSFGWLYRIASAPADPGWQPFSLAKLKQVAVDEGRTVLVDFSAEWCINCKVFEKAVLHTKPVEQAIERANAVTMYADFTDYPEEIARTIKALGANGVPVIAIFPGDNPYQPIVFRDGYTQQGLISALNEANGRGQPAANVAEAATTVPSRN